jgi:hypothetical protein
MYGEEIVQAFREFKAIWHPQNRMNSGRIVDPYPIDSDIRVGPRYQPPKLETHFAFPEDDGSFARGCAASAASSAGSTATASPSCSMATLE